MKQFNGSTTGYWIATSLFALQMGFTAYAQLRLPQVAEAFICRTSSTGSWRPAPRSTTIFRS